MTFPRRRKRLPVSVTVPKAARINTRQWRKFRDQVVKEEPVCWLRFPGICTIQSETADHIIPRKHRPDLTYVRSNARGACQRCNMRRGDLPAHQIPELRAQLVQRPAKALRYFR